MAESVQLNISQTLDRSKLLFSRSWWMIEHIEQTLKLVPDDAERHYSLALVEVMLGKFDDAIKSLDKALEAKPSHLPSLWLLGELHFKYANYEASVELLERVVRSQPDNLTAITWLSLAYHNLGKQGKAISKQSILQTIAPDLIVTLSR